MKTLLQSVSSFDRLLFGGLGCGILVLCILGAWIFYILNAMPVPGSRATEVAIADTPADNPVPLPDVATATLLPQFTPAPTEALPTALASFLPPVFAENPPTGKIVYTCFVKQIDQVCLMNADGTGHKQLTDLPATAFYASLSPDGQTVYFASRQTGLFEIYSIDIQGKNLERLTRNIGSLYGPELAPNGERIIFAKQGEGVWIMKADGKNPHPITDGDDVDATWSPDGSKIAFASARNGGRQLFVMNADGSNIQQVTHLDDMGGRNTWSPDGKKLAFYRGPAGDHDIFIINVDGTGLMQLTDGGDNLGPSWSPDGNWIAFTSYRDGNNNIYIMHPDGTEVTRLTENPISEWQPRWGP